MRSWIVVATLVVLAVQPTTGLAQTGTWVSHGPEGGNIAALAIDPRSPSIVYAGALGSGVFKSTDAGDTWDAVGPPNAQVVALAIDAVSALSAGVFRSVDGVGTWQAFSEGLNNTAIGALLVDPVASSTVYAATFGGGVIVRPAD